MYGTGGAVGAGALAVTGLATGSILLTVVALVFTGVVLVMLARKNSPHKP